MEISAEETHNKNRSNSIWAERYRPTSMDTYVGGEDLKTKVKQYIKDNDIPHLLLYGGPGTGKTTLAKIITKAIKCDVMYINASDENGIDTIRGKIKSFASSMGFTPLKVIILDECLDENTRVCILRNGKEQSIFIKDLDDKNDLVKSYNVKTEQIEWMPFTLFDKGEQDVYKISLETGEVVVCTPNHKWYVEENGLKKVVKASELHKYNHILSP